MTEMPGKKWPWWKMALAYLALAGLAAASIALVDRKVHDPPASQIRGSGTLIKGNNILDSVGRIG
jgi:hypothetical protein